MDNVTRRKILGMIARGGIACGCGHALSRFAILDALAADAADVNPFKVATTAFLGRQVSRLGFGMMRLPQKGRGVIDEELSDKLVDYAIRHGGHHFDTAGPYIGGQPQRHSGEELGEYDRGKL